MAIIEAIFAFVVLFLILFFVINFCFVEKSIIKKYRLSSLITNAIVLGIILVIRIIFETFGMWIQIFRTLNNDLLYFAIMITIFLFLNKKLLPKFIGSRISPEEISQTKSFNKIINRLLIIAWILAGIFLSITFLQIELRDPAFPNYPDKFGLGVMWSFAVVLICIIITSIINRFLSNEKRIEKKILRSAMYGAGFLAFSVWFIQLVIFEVYINSWLGFLIIRQDIRVLFIVVVGLYSSIFFNLLKGKLLPESSEKSSKKVKELLVSELKKQHRNYNAEGTELLVEDQDSHANIISEEKVTNYPQGITLKSFVYLLKKLKVSTSLEDETLTDNKLNKKSNKILTGLLWGIPILVILLVRMLIIPNLFTEVLFLSCMCALFMVGGDLALTFLFNRISTVDKRISKIFFRQSALYGGLLSFWIWIIPFFVIYLYLFWLIADIVILNITFITILSIAMFVLGTRIILWYATSIKMWDAAMKKAVFVKKKASRVNLVWFICNIPLRIFLFILTSGAGIYYSNILSIFWADNVWPTKYELLIPFLIN
ncbi:MAG: hypothetical protein ACXAAH_14545, partial [Promethearchaeota archaeon]